MEVLPEQFFLTKLDEEREVLEGSLSIRVKFQGLSFSLRGIYVSRRKDVWYIGLPKRRVLDHFSGEPVQYCIFNLDPPHWDEFKAKLREAGIDYILKRLADKENPLTLPKVQKPKGQPAPIKKEEVAPQPEAKKVSNPALAEAQAIGKARAASRFARPMQAVR